MKKILSLFVSLVLISVSTMYTQTLNDYVKQVKGDTLVIKDYSDMNNQSNSLYWAMVLDTDNVPAGRVYELQAGGWYPLQNNPTSSSKHPTVIVGSDPTMVINNKNAASSPPLISGYSGVMINTGEINAGGDLTIKNCDLENGASNGWNGGSFTYTNASNLNLVYDNCIFEHTMYWFVWLNGDSNENATFRNCYFVNMNGHPCRRNGGVLICNSNSNQDTLLVENCTHIMAHGELYKFFNAPGHPFKRIIFNHNTFVNCGGPVFNNPGYLNNVSLTNNIFVNCNVQSWAGVLFIDPYENDPDRLPIGLVNVYPDSADVANNTPRKFLCQNNLAYWDPWLANIDSILDANKVNGATNWQSQMIIMNARTDSMFKHIGRFNTTPYSYCNTDIWKNQMPHFTDPKNLFTTQLANLKTDALGTVDTEGTVVLPDWRLVNTGTSLYIYPDWPIPVDLSYSDTDLLQAGVGGFPLGDLNWFPTQKAQWDAQKVAEHTAIEAALQAGHTTAVKNVNALPVEFTLNQNYPNPFNPSTTITFSLPHSANTSLKVFDMLGREVATLVNEYTTSGTHEVQFNATNVSSGVYFYKLTSGDFTQIKKMTLVK